MIRFLKHHEIDKQKWDDAIGDSSAKSVYALSWYLDCVSNNWCALIEDDYISVMPLPVKPKWGITLITQPILCQQLGIFFTEKSLIKDLTVWLTSIPVTFPLIRLCLNGENAKDKSIKGKPRNNYLLDLSNNYDTISGLYSNDCKRNIAKARNKAIITKTITIDEAFAFFKQNESIFDNQQMRTIFDTIKSQNLLSISAASHHETLISVSFFVKSFTSYIYLASCTNNHGRKSAANYLLIDLFIREHCNSKSILDFEGSTIDSIAKFFAGFGATKIEFLQVKRWNIF